LSVAGALYRVRQFFAAVRARPPDAVELDLARRYLPPGAFELFQTMPASDRRHSLTILQGLLAQGYADLPLLQAALLHDVAKAQLGLGARAAMILLNATSTRLLPRLAFGNPRSWRYTFFLSLHHPELGAAAAERAGLDPRAVTLIRRHQAPLAGGTDGDELGRWQRALKSLDDQN
jgi:hypothetical protein